MEMRSLGSIVPPVTLVVVSTVWIVGQYISGIEEITIVVNVASAMGDFVTYKYSHRSVISTKCTFISAKWTFGSGNEEHFIVWSWVNTSTWCRTLFEVASSVTASHMSLAIISFIIFWVRHSEIDEVIKC